MVPQDNPAPVWLVTCTSLNFFEMASRVLRYLEKMVGAPRFELGTSWSRTKRATRLRYAPTKAAVSGQWLVASGWLQLAARPRH